MYQDQLHDVADISRLTMKCTSIASINPNDSTHQNAQCIDKQHIDPHPRVTQKPCRPLMRR
jgi:hypothetical protein